MRDRAGQRGSMSKPIARLRGRKASARLSPNSPSESSTVSFTPVNPTMNARDNSGVVTGWERMEVVEWAARLLAGEIKVARQ